MDKKQIAKILEEFGILLDLKGENPFRVRSYINGARAVENLSEDIGELVESGELLKVKGIGKGLAAGITELMNTGKYQDYETLKNSFPPGVLDMLRIGGLGPKKVKIIYQKLGVSSVGELEYAAKENRLRTLEGFGAKSETNILEGIEVFKRGQGRFLTHIARRWADYVLTCLSGHPDIQRIDLAGSLRRRRETSKDIDIVAAAENAANIMDAFTEMDEVEQVIARGETKSTVRLHSGISVDLRVVKNAEYPFLLHHLTGSKEHNTLMRSRAKKLGIKMNEYGLFKDDTLIACEDETAIFQALQLSYIPPELREGLDELDRAETGDVLQLIADEDMHGILHVHTTHSDGVGTVEQMVQAASERGATFIGITDHSQTAVYANGLNAQRVQEQHEEIDRLQQQYPDIRIFKGIESDILPDGSLDYPDDVMASFDFVIASIHSKFKMDEREATDRVLNAIRHPHVHMLGHPTGRLLLGRDGYPVNMPEVIAAAREANVVIELNANPHRLDIDWRHLPATMEQGVAIAINSDAHRISDYDHIPVGVGIARKGRVMREQVMNTWTVEQVETFFREGYGS